VRGRRPSIVVEEEESMEGLVSLLVFAGLFYFMMRFGCGAHAVHGHGGGHAGHQAGQGGHDGSAQPADATDPVCGMTVGPDEGYAKMYAGRVYRFCSRPCLDKFDLNPDQYGAVQGGAQ